MSKKIERKGAGARADVDPELAAILDRGYEAKKAREDINLCVERLVKRMMKKYPGQSRILRSVLDGYRQQLLTDQEAKKRRDREAQCLEDNE